MKFAYKTKEIHEELNKVLEMYLLYLTQLPSGLGTLAKVESLIKEEHSGRPCSSLTKETVARADAIVAEDCCITLQFLASELGVSL